MADADFCTATDAATALAQGGCGPAPQEVSNTSGDTVCTPDRRPAGAVQRSAAAGLDSERSRRAPLCTRLVSTIRAGGWLPSLILCTASLGTPPGEAWEVESDRPSETGSGEVEVSRSRSELKEEL